MSYREDFIRLATTDAYNRSRGVGGRRLTDQSFLVVAESARTAVQIRVRAQQVQLFLDAPVIAEQDYRAWFRLPFPSLWIHPEGVFVFDGFDHGVDEEIATTADPTERERLEAIKRIAAPQVKAVHIEEIARASATAAWTVNDPPGWGGAERVYVMSWIMPLPHFDLNMYTMTMAVLADGRLLLSEHEGQQESMRSRMRAWIIHLVNYLNSPAIKLVRVEPDAKLQKARVRRGQPPLAGWYEIQWRHQVGEYTKSKTLEKRWAVGFRFDVRAHQRHYTRGPMAGRVVWVRTHQRGVRHALYRPKGYRTEEVRPAVERPS